MRPTRDPEKHYRVMRFFTDFNAGLIEEEVASELTLEEAETLAQQISGIPGEEIVVQDQLKKGLEAEISPEGPRPRARF